jgi:dephospho-CoA kinase
MRQESGNMIVIGITGSIGMGKSTAAGMLREMGIPVYDADAAVHALLAPGGGGVSAVGDKFPEALKKNAAGEFYIDRAALGRLIFSDRPKKKELEGILHPLVWAQSDRFIADMKKQGHRAVALDVPLLFETGEARRVDVVLCISAAQELQQQRVLARPGMTLEKFNSVVAGQLPDAEKRQRADYVIETDKGIEDTRQQLKRVIGRILPPAPPAATPPKIP